jgi:integrase/recombinase XerC/integrase/recombinase XerD
MGTKALTLKRPASLSQGADVRALVAEWRAAIELRCAAGEVSPATVRTYRIGVERFMAWCGERRTLDADVIRAWLADMRGAGFLPGTVNTWLASVRDFFGWAVGAYRLPYNPAASIRGAKRKGTSRQHKRDVLTDAEVRRVLALPGDDDTGARDKAIMSIMAYTGARAIELHRADLSDARTERGRLVLHVRGKGRTESDEVIVIAHPDAESALHDWLAVRGNKPGALFTSLSRRSAGARLSVSAMLHIVKGYYRAAGVRGARKTTHSLRHAAISNAVRHGAPVQKVQAMARHANISTTMIYYHETDRVENPAEAFVDYSQG